MLRSVRSNSNCFCFVGFVVPEMTEPKPTMEQVKRRRGPVRRSATILCKEIETLLKVDPVAKVSVEAKMRLLVANNEQLQKLDTDMMDLLASVEPEEGSEVNPEDEMDQELATVRKYQEKFSEMQIRLEQLCSSKLQMPGSEYGTANSSEGKKRQFKLPKIELKKFSGEVTGWLSWWAQFQKIHEDEDLHASDKFQYLVQAMKEGTRARELVESYPQTSDNYPKVIVALQERFGKEKLLTQVYVRELLKMVINNAKSKEKVNVAKMFDKLESHLRALESLNVSGDQMARFLYPMVESSIPEETLIAWQRSPMYEHDGSQEIPPRTELDYLILFLKKEVEREEQRAFAQSGFGVNSDVEKSKSPSHKGRAYETEGRPVTAAALYAGGGRESCIFCDKSSHPSHACFRLQKMTQFEKNEKMREANVCFKCLKTGHRVWDCPAAITCTSCGGGHYKFLCSRKREDESVEQIVDGVQALTTIQHAVALGATCLDEKRVLLGTMKVKVFSEKGDFREGLP